MPLAIEGVHRILWEMSWKFVGYRMIEEEFVTSSTEKVSPCKFLGLPGLTDKRRADDPLETSARHRQLPSPGDEFTAIFGCHLLARIVGGKVEDSNVPMRPSKMRGIARITNIDGHSEVSHRSAIRTGDRMLIASFPCHRMSVRDIRTRFKGRRSFAVEPDMLLAVERYSEAGRMSTSELVNRAVEEYFIGKQEKDGVTSTNDRVALESPGEIAHFSRV
ncbi:hypothetical protein Q3C01_17555 [Bradyrhizobium sp. UFLA05-109]